MTSCQEAAWTSLRIGSKLSTELSLLGTVNTFILSIQHIFSFLFPSISLSLHTCWERALTSSQSPVGFLPWHPFLDYQPHLSFRLVVIWVLSPRWTYKQKNPLYSHVSRTANSSVTADNGCLPTSKGTRLSLQRKVTILLYHGAHMTLEEINSIKMQLLESYNIK